MSTPPKAPNTKWAGLFYKLALNSWFEWIMYGVIMVDFVCTVTELNIDNDIGLLVLTYVNYTFCVLYFIEAAVKIIGLRQHYFKSVWNWFDAIILLVSIVVAVFEIAVPKNALVHLPFSPSGLRIVRILRILRFGRVLRLTKVSTLSC